MSDYKISIVIPTYNKIKYLPHAMESVLTQTIGFENLQVLLVDDHSTDGTWELVQKYAEQYSNVFAYQTQSNSGAAGLPRNIALEHSKAPYIMFLDPDDSFLPDACAFLFSKIQQGCGEIVGGTYESVASDGQKRTFSLENWEVKEYTLPNQLTEALINRFPMWTKIYSRKMIERNGIRFPTSGYGQDTVFLCACLAHASKYSMYNVPVYTYLVMPDSVSNVQSDVFFEKNRACIQNCMSTLWNYPEAATAIGRELGDYYARKCVEFEDFDKTMLVQTFRRYPELFAPVGVDDSQNVTAVLIRAGRFDAAAEYTLTRRAEKKEYNRVRNGLEWHLGHEQELKSHIVALTQSNATLEARVKTLEGINGAQKDVIDSLQAQLQNIRGNRFYRLFVKVYKFLRNEKNALKKLLHRKPRSAEVGSAYKADTAIAMVEAGFTAQLATPKVSVIIPVYNNADYLKDCIDSAVAQTYPNIEIVIVDDCSPDPRVQEILSAYVGNSRVKLFKNEKNTGICGATNEAMIRATGEWFAFLDCDDWLAENAIQTVMDRIKGRPDVRFAYTNRVNHLNHSGEEEVVDFGVRPTRDYEDNLIAGMYTSHLKVIRRDTFARIGLYDGFYNGTQDYDISLKIAHYYGDAAFLFVREPVYYHRIHENQTTNVQNDSMLLRASQLVADAKLRQKIRRGSFEKMVSIIVLSFNKCDQTIDCISAIRKTVSVPYEIILWDNKSKDKTIARLRELYENATDVRLFFSPENIGCGGGRRAAVRYAQGDFVVFLDNDIVVTENWLTELLVRMYSRKNVAAVNSRVVFPDGKVQINGLRYAQNDGFITFSLSGSNQPISNLITAQWMENDWINGGSTLYRKDVFLSLKGLEQYPNAFEDNDASIQMRRQGYILLNCPASVVIHNHMNYVDPTKIEKEYVAARYNDEKMIVSAVTFYKRNHLIIDDEYLYRLMGIGAGNRKAIRAYYDKKLEELKP